MIIDNFLINFLSVWKYTNWPILVLSHLLFFCVDWYNICMFQFITYAVVKVLTNKTTKQIYVKFYDFCWNVATLTNFTNIKIFNNFTDFIFIYVINKLRIVLNSLCLILTTTGSFWNVLIAANTGSWLLLILDTSSWIFGSLRSETMFAK